MPFKKGLANTTSYIERYINTAYDQVLTVYNNLASIITLAAQDANITEIASVGDLSALEANMTAFLASPHTGMKDPVVAASTANVALTGLQTLDGISLTAGMRFLAKDQTDPIENGIYLVVDGAAWTRASDWDNIVNVTDVNEGTTVPVSRGTANALTYWTVTTTGSIVVGTTSVAFIAGLTNIGIAATTTVVNDVADTTCFPVFMNDATGDNAMKSDAAKLKFNAATGQLDASIFNASIFNASGQANAANFAGALDGVLGGVTPAAATVTSLTSGGDMLSDTDGTDSIGSTAVRWLKGWFDSLTITGDVGAATLTLGGVVQPVVGVQVANHVRAGNTQLIDGSAAHTRILISGVVTASTWETVGPTGEIAGGGDNDWAEMDILPANATILIVDVEVGTVATSAAGFVYMYAAKGDITGTVAAYSKVIEQINDHDSGGDLITTMTRLHIPLDSTLSFKVHWLGGGTSQTLALHYRGFITD